MSNKHTTLAVFKIRGLPLGLLFLINCITNISYKKLGSAGGAKIKIKSVVPLRDEKRN